MNPKRKKAKPADKPAVEPNKEELQETKNRLLRTLADFDNYKKRAAVEKAQFVQFANENLIQELLPILDGFSRASEAAQKVNAGEEMLKGLDLIKKQLQDVLKKHGVEEIDAAGKAYDPNFHQAMIQQEYDGPEGMILQEMLKGYTLRGRLIRPAMVIVSKKKT